MFTLGAPLTFAQEAAPKKSEQKPILDVHRAEIRIPVGTSSVSGGGAMDEPAQQGRRSENYGGLEFGLYTRKIGANRTMKEFDVEMNSAASRFGGGHRAMVAGRIGKARADGLLDGGGSMYLMGTAQGDLQSTNGLAVESALTAGVETGAVIPNANSLETGDVDHLRVFGRVGTGTINPTGSDFPLANLKNLIEFGASLQVKDVKLGKRPVGVSAGTSVRLYNSTATVNQASARVSVCVSHCAASVFGEARAKYISSSDRSLRSGSSRVLAVGLSVGAPFIQSSANSGR